MTTKETVTDCCDEIKEKIPHLVSASEISPILGVGRNTIIKLASDGEIPHYRFGPKIIRFRLEDVQAWVEASKISK